MVEPETTLQRRDGNVSMESEEGKSHDIAVESEGIEAGRTVVQPLQATNTNLSASADAHSQRPMDVNSHRQHQANGGNNTQQTVSVSGQVQQMQNGSQHGPQNYASNGVVSQQNATSHARVAMPVIPEDRRSNEQLVDQQEDMLRQPNQDGSASLDLNSQGQRLAEEIAQFTKKVQIHEQQWRDRIINRGEEGNGGSSQPHELQAQRLKPRMQCQIGGLSTDSQSAIQAMSGELVAARNLLAGCDNRVDKEADLGRQPRTVARSADPEHGQVELNTKNIRVVAEPMRDTHSGQVNPAAPIITQSRDSMRPTHFVAAEQRLQQDRRDLANAADALCELTELAVASYRKDLGIAVSELELGPNPSATVDRDWSAIPETPSRYRTQQEALWCRAIQVIELLGSLDGRIILALSRHDPQPLGPLRDQVVHLLRKQAGLYTAPGSIAPTDEQAILAKLLMDMGVKLRKSPAPPEDEDAVNDDTDQQRRDQSRYQRRQDGSRLCAAAYQKRPKPQMDAEKAESDKRARQALVYTYRAEEDSLAYGGHQNPQPHPSYTRPRQIPSTLNLYSAGGSGNDLQRLVPARLQGARTNLQDLSARRPPTNVDQILETMVAFGSSVKSLRFP